MASGIAAALLLLAAGQAGGPRLDASAGVVIGASRVLGLAGAYVGVAEGMDGAALNPAAVAHRDRHLDRGWDWDFTLVWFLPGADALAHEDVGNQGTPDARLTGRANLQAGLGGQWGRLGAGLLARSWALSGQDAGGATVGVTTSDVAIHLGWSAWEDQLVIGAAVGGVSGEVKRVAAGSPTATRAYQGAQARAGLLWRPRGRAFRLGLAADPGSSATPHGEAPAGLATPSAFSFPSQLTLGFACWLGRDAVLFNEPSPAARRQLGLDPDPDLAGAGAEPVLLAVDLGAVGRSSGAVRQESLFARPGDAAPPPAGRRVGLLARAAAEWEALPRRLAIRGGSYLEPSRTEASWRPHATMGADVRVTAYWDFRVGFSADLARRFQNLSLSLGLWKDYGPLPPPPP